MKDNHVLRYFYKEEDIDHINLALELCEGSMNDLALGTNDRLKTQNVHCLLKQATRGLIHIHKKKIVHGDLKPENILIYMDNNIAYSKIADFGVSKRAKAGSSSVTGITGGSPLWSAPECLDSVRGRSRKSEDTYSMGLIIVFVHSKGKHLLGDYDSLSNTACMEVIKKGNLNWSILSDDEPWDCTAKSLLVKMLAKKLNERQSAKNVLLHPIFWTLEDQTLFLSDVSNKINMDGCLETGNSNLLTNKNIDWKLHLDFPELIKALDDYNEKNNLPPYDGKKVNSLLRAVRNIYHHHGDAHDKRLLMLCSNWVKERR